MTPCVPGAEITEEIGDTQFRGTVKVKLGAVQVVYRGELEIQADESTRTITLNGKGTELRGSGGAKGSATVTLVEQGEGMTQVTVQSHVDVTGRVAQFGRGIMQDVANRLMNEFAGCLEQKLRQEADTLEEASAAQATAGESGGNRPTIGEQTEATSSADSNPPTLQSTSTGTAGQSTTGVESEHQIELLPLLMSVARSRLAAGLRRLAQLVEPR